MHAAVEDSFKLIGVQPGAEPEVVEAAYRALMKKYHPDRAGGASDASKAQEINAAYALIKQRREAAPAAPTDPAKWDPTTEIVLTPPLRTGRNFLVALTLSAAILAALTIIVT